MEAKRKEAEKILKKNLKHIKINNPDYTFEKTIDSMIEFDKIGNDDLNKKVFKIMDLINFHHNDLAKSIIDIKTYNPLSHNLIEIKEKLSNLVD